MMMNNIIKPRAPRAGPAASPHRLAIPYLNFSLQPLAFSLLFARGWNFEKRNLSKPFF
jgi:hypothetical protein